MITETGCWDISNNSEHCFDLSLAEAIFNFISVDKFDSLYDLGCGNGNYIKFFREKRIQCLGYDGNPNTEKLSKGMCRTLDLSTVHSWTTICDWTMSLEVGEHIPAKYEKAYIENLHCSNSKGIILSWGVPGQRGPGHINCKTEFAVKKIFKNLNYINDIEAENELRLKSSLAWFKKTIMVFRKGSV